MHASVIVSPRAPVNHFSPPQLPYRVPNGVRPSKPRIPERLGPNERVHDCQILAAQTERYAETGLNGWAAHDVTATIRARHSSHVFP